MHFMKKMYNTLETLLQVMHFLFGTTTCLLHVSVCKYISKDFNQ